LKDLPPARDGSQYARIKTFSNNYAVCRDTKYFIVDGTQYKTVVPARLKGLGDQTITELFLEEVHPDLVLVLTTIQILEL